MKMKKKLAVLLIATMAISMVGCGSSSDSSKEASSSGETAEVAENGEIAQFKDGWGDTNTAFDPLAIEETWSFEEMRENLGAVPKSDQAIALAGNIRTEDNVYWTALRDGYKEMVNVLNKGGLSNVTIDVQSALNEADTEGQLAVMKDQIRTGANAIMISPISTSNCTEGVETAHEDGIPTIAVNNEFNGADMFVGPNSYEEENRLRNGQMKMLVQEKSLLSWVLQVSM